MNLAEQMRLENEAGDLMSMGADPRRVLGVLAPFSGQPRTRASWLRSSAWLALARREGPSAEAESWLRFAYEAALVDLRVNAKIYDAADVSYEASSPARWRDSGRHRPDDMLMLGVGQPFAAWFEYLVMFGRFAEAQAERSRAAAILGRGYFARPRPQIRAAVEALAAMATPDVFYRALLPDFLPHLASIASCEVSELRVSRTEGMLPNGGGMLETICVAFPVPLFTGEPLWIAFARVHGSRDVRVFSLDWFGDEWSAQPAAWARNHYLSERDYGTSIAPGAAPRPNLGPSSPYLQTFMAFVAQRMSSLVPPGLGVAVPGSYPPAQYRAPIPTLAPQSVPPAATRPRRGVFGWVVLAVVAFVLLMGLGFKLVQWRQDAERRARIESCRGLGLPAKACDGSLGGAY